MRILGVSFDYHDSAACLVEDGTIVAAAQEERFSRQKHDARLPVGALRYCLGEASGPLDAVAFYDKPISKLHRFFETYLAVAPRGAMDFSLSIPGFLRDKLWVEPRLRRTLATLGQPDDTPILFSEHHLSHAASAFFPSPFDQAAVLTIDGVGEWATASLGMGKGIELRVFSELRFPHSLGLLYSAFTAHCGFRVNDGEYKLMGLAPYGEPRFKRAILDELMDLKDDGSFHLDLSYFSFHSRRSMTTRRFDRRFGGPRREAHEPLRQRELDLARSIQEATEEVVVRMARSLQKRTGARKLCMAGGVALNAVANRRVLREAGFEELFVQPAAGDAGGALGAALAAAHLTHREPRSDSADRMAGAYLGPHFSDAMMRELLDKQE
ncbi:MAG: carbamoyltransferase N-terminal domain-containing protein, partial [Myxococcota bacterium]